MSAWTSVTEALRQQGSLGSALFTGPDGTFCAIARWPDRATRQASDTQIIGRIRGEMASCIKETLIEWELDECVNRWIPDAT